MDHSAEQEMELEALEAILMEDMTEFSGTLPDPWPACGKTYRVEVHPEEEETATGEPSAKLELIFAHTKAYPEEAPLLKLRSVRGLSDMDLAEAQVVLDRSVEENLGMAMIFNLVQAAKDWLHNRQNAEPEEDPDLARKRAEAEEEQRRAAARAHGTPVTADTFREWKLRFDAEMASSAKQAAAAKEGEKAGRLTGKQWFMRADAEGHVDQDDVPSSEDEAEDAGIEDDEDEDADDILYEEDEEDEEDDMLDDYLAGKAS